MKRSLNTWIKFLLQKTKLEGAVQIPIGVVLLGPILTWLKEDVLKCILQGWKALSTSCFTDLLLAAIPANVNTDFVVTLHDLDHLLPSFYLCIFGCEFEKLWALRSEQVHCAQSIWGTYPINQGTSGWFEMVKEGWFLGIFPSSVHSAVLKCWNSIKVAF